MKKILVCEDEAAIRDFVVINLTRAGYDVVEADCGEAALQKYEENNGDFDVAILDVMKPQRRNRNYYAFGKDSGNGQGNRTYARCRRLCYKAFLTE